MITMRSNCSNTKTGKPPPPIPPRPNKALVAESLAKLRKSPIQNRIDENALSPTRIAPPPPQFDLIEKPNNSILKSQSHSTVNLINDNLQIHKIQRSISHSDEDSKINSRTVIFQSANLKTSTLELKLKRNDSNRQRSEDKNNKNSSISGSSDDTSAKPVVHETLTEGDDPNIINCDDNSTDEWNKLLNGKNHVNTLIDEMFASILDTPDNKEKSEIDAKNRSEIQSSVDSTKIVVNTECNGHTNETVLSTTTSSIKNEEIPEHPTTLFISADIGVTNGSNENLKESVDTQTVKNNRVKFDDKKNHEFLITELQSMRREQERQRNSSGEFSGDDVPKIHHSDWVEINDGKEIRLSSCQIIIEDGVNNSTNTVADPVISRLNMSSLHGLPPLPKSLSGFSLLENQRNSQGSNRSTPVRGTPPGFTSGQVVYPPHPRSVNGTGELTTGRKATNLDNQLAILRREMYSLRQLDLTLLSQLWSLNESIQDFRQMLQDQDDRALLPPSPSPSPSSCDDGDADEFFSPSPMRLRPAPPPPPLRRTSNSSSANSSEYGTV
ncbi:hypothetical protein RN001_003148 [Aquatica leii]|uniref:Protein FAM89A n=1 Tax=Aquatica leii TaxID=1421715 RepID=A0AAN7SKK1_9COLE|nr:hypothetical protein RN001_003148 [Aquatica leii]